MTFVEAYIGDTPLFQESTPVPAVGLPILKTGQTISYQAGDDGDIQAGRSVDFFTLASNNPFGNTNRFTDINGLQVYSNNIIIDWSTFDGSSVLGYRRGITTNYLFTDVLTELASGGSLFSHAGYSGWRCPNISELHNIANWGTNPVWSYSPINFPTGVNMWTNTAVPSATTNVYAGFNTGPTFLNSAIKIAARRVLPVRTFTVTGTILT